MKERKEWFTLAEAAEILRPECDGRPLPQDEAVKMVLDWVFAGDDLGFFLTASVLFDEPVRIRQGRTIIDKDKNGFASIKPGLTIKGFWRPRTGFPQRRRRYVLCPPPYFLHPFKTCIDMKTSDCTGLFDLLFQKEFQRHGSIILDGSGDVLLCDPGDPEYPTGYVYSGPLEIKESSLVFSRQSLFFYAEQRGRRDIIKLLDEPGHPPKCDANDETTSATSESAPDIERVAEFIGNRRLPFVGNREVVPVRLIPFITLRKLGQKRIAGVLANRLRVSGFDRDPDCDPPDHGFRAYYLGDQNKPVRMRPSEWELVYRDLSVLRKQADKREEENGVKGSMCRMWLQEATQILPSSVFLWRDDLEELWKAHVACFAPWEGEPEDFRVMNYDALILPEYQDLVFKGFEHLLEALAPPLQPEAPGGSSVSGPAPCVSSNTEPVSYGEPGKAEGDTPGTESKPRGVKGPRTPFSQALDRLYRYFHDKGEKEVISKGSESMRLFLRRLAQYLKKPSKDDSEASELHEYISQRIEVVQPSELVRTIKSAEQWGKHESRWYSYANISAELSRLRKKYSREAPKKHS